MFLIRKIKKYKKKIALIDENLNEISYNQIDIISDKYSKLLKSNKLIFIVSNYSNEMIFFYISSLKSKCLIKFLNPSINKDFLLSLIKKFQPHYILCSSKTILNKNYKELYKTTNDLKLYEIIIMKEYKIHPELMFLQSTSGSTGSAKCVKLTKKNIEINTKDIIKSLKISKNHTTITTLPISYVYGLSIINTHLFSGAKIILNNTSIFQKKFWDFFSKYKINSFGGVPFSYEILTKINFLKKTVLKNLTYTTVAGGKLI